MGFHNENHALIHHNRHLPPAGKRERMEGIDLLRGNGRFRGKKIIDYGNFADNGAIDLFADDLGNIDLNITFVFRGRRLFRCTMVVTASLVFFGMLLRMFYAVNEIEARGFRFDMMVVGNDNQGLHRDAHYRQHNRDPFMFSEHHHRKVIIFL